MFQIGERNLVLTEKVFGFDACFARENPGTDSIKGLQTCGAGRKLQKRPTLFVGKKAYGKSRMKLAKLQETKSTIRFSARLFRPKANEKTGSWTKGFWAMIACDLIAAFLALLWLKPLAGKTVEESNSTLHRVDMSSAVKARSVA